MKVRSTRAVTRSANVCVLTLRMLAHSAAHIRIVGRPAIVAQTKVISVVGCVVFDPLESALDV